MKNRHFFFTSTLVLLLMFLAACTGGTGKDTLKDTTWRLTSLNGSTPLAQTTITISFKDGMAGGSSGCNSYGGEYEAKGDKLSVKSVFMTEMACMTDGVMDQEQVYAEILQNAQSFSLTEGTLLITAADGRTLTFVTETFLPD